MHVDTGSFAALQGEVGDLRREVAELNASVERLAMFTTIQEVLAAERRAGAPAAARARRPRHLRVMEGGQS